MQKNGHFFFQKLVEHFNRFFILIKENLSVYLCKNEESDNSFRKCNVYEAVRFIFFLSDFLITVITVAYKAITIEYSTRNFVLSIIVYRQYNNNNNLVMLIYHYLLF